MKKKIKINSKVNSYEVNFNNNLAKSFANLKKETIFVVDSKVYKIYLKKIIKNRKFIILSSSEKTKDFLNLKKIINFFINNVSKNTLVVAVGGGVIQDVTSFLSSIFKRGIDWYFFPTTLISQGDSCIGGKTSINFNKIKNQLGNFYPPKKIVINSHFLRNISKKEIFSGFGEMGHYFFLSNNKDFKYYKKSLFNFSKNKKVNLNEMIFRSLKIKKKYIEKDEFDQNIRLKLNYGHTFGHAIENLINIPHGIAVAHGMNISNYVSYKLGYLNFNQFNIMEDTLKIILKKYPIKKVNLKRFIQIMRKDKKSINKKIRVILSKGIGNMFVSKINNEKKFLNILKEYFNRKVSIK
jgi:3-dehydroquinate synthase